MNGWVQFQYEIVDMGDQKCLENAVVIANWMCKMRSVGAPIVGLEAENRQAPFPQARVVTVIGRRMKPAYFG